MKPCLCAVAVGVVAAAADGQQRAGPAGRGERAGTCLTGGDAGVAQGVVEAVAEDVESGGGGRVVGGLQGVDLFDRAVGLDDDGVDRVEAQRFGGGGQAEQQGEALLEEPDPGLPPAGRPPAVEDGAQPVAVRGRARRSRSGARCPRVGYARRRGGPVAVRQQQVQGRWAKGEQRLVHLDGVGPRVDDGEDARVGVGVPVGEEPGTTGGGGPGGAARVVGAEGVVSGPDRRRG